MPGKIHIKNLYSDFQEETDFTQNSICLRFLANPLTTYLSHVSTLPLKENIFVQISIYLYSYKEDNKIQLSKREVEVEKTDIVVFASSTLNW